MSIEALLFVLFGLLVLAGLFTQVLRFLSQMLGVFALVGVLFLIFGSKSCMLAQENLPKEKGEQVKVKEQPEDELQFIQEVEAKQSESLSLHLSKERLEELARRHQALVQIQEAGILVILPTHYFNQSYQQSGLAKHQSFAQEQLGLTFVELPNNEKGKACVDRLLKNKLKADAISKQEILIWLKRL